MARNGEYTPTEQRIINMLSDGQSHTTAELKTCLDDELASASAVRFHISNIRQRLRPKGEDIVYVMHFQRKLAYRHVKSIAPPTVGNGVNGVIRIR